MAAAASRVGRAVAERIRPALTEALVAMLDDEALPEHTRATIAALLSSERRIDGIEEMIAKAVMVEVAMVSLGVRPGDPTRPVR